MCYKSIKSQVGRLCTILLTIVGFSSTSQCGPPTSQRHFLPSLPRRDVDLDVATSNLYVSATSRCGFTSRDVKFICLCHVVTWIYTSRRQIYMSLSRRDVEFPRRDVTLTLLCYVATSIYTSRRGLVQVSVTSRRGPERRDVV